MERIEDRLASALDAFSSASKSWAKGRSPGPIQMLRLSNAAKSLERELTDGRGIRDLRLIASTCNDPDLIRTEVMSLLDRQDVPDRIVAFLEGSGLLDRIIRTAEGLDRPARNG